MPVRARKAMSWPPEWAKAESNEPVAKMAMPESSAARRPNRSPMAPATSRSDASVERVGVDDPRLRALAQPERLAHLREADRQHRDAGDHQHEGEAHGHEHEGALPGGEALVGLERGRRSRWWSGDRWRSVGPRRAREVVGMVGPSIQARATGVAPASLSSRPPSAPRHGAGFGSSCRAGARRWVGRPGLQTTMPRIETEVNVTDKKSSRNFARESKVTPW